MSTFPGRHSMLRRAAKPCRTGQVVDSLTPLNGRQTEALPFFTIIFIHTQSGVAPA
ncbi:MAG: hypothetical protein V2J51_03050 [Erythrobacter sp.]|nr:hypothetical protein [Erythrobacter sp.]